ncbi:unnamed protein product [Dimorphilus gyrociliatus]|uniref:Uncharacterized protein n=1 Tax=Dimorphilus gyrociliatus TaxID=2664684 RepID=A0A7I8VZ32_9ANNE|nr:unnamed protein product [Dimorphilus gyrociliatus]
MSCAVTKAFQEKRYKQAGILLELGFDNCYQDEKDGRNVLHKCALVDVNDRREVLNLISILIKRKGSDLVNSRDKFGKTILHLALENEYFSAVKLLLSSDLVDLTVADNNGYTALHLCSERGYTKLTSFIVKRMTKYRLSIDQRTKDKGMTALMLACSKGNFNIAKILYVDGKASTTMRDDVQFQNAKEILETFVGGKCCRDFLEVLEENLKLKQLPMRRCKSARTLYHPQTITATLDCSSSHDKDSNNNCNNRNKTAGTNHVLDRPKTASAAYKRAQFHYVFGLYSDVCSTSYTTAFKVEETFEQIPKKSLTIDKAEKLSSAKMKLQNLIKLKKSNTLFNTVKQLKTRNRSESTRHSSQSSIFSTESAKKHSPNKHNSNHDVVRNIWKKTLSLSSTKSEPIPHTNLLKKIVKLRHTASDDNQADNVFD